MKTMQDIYGQMLAAVEENGEIIPKIKSSENTAKITNPHFKKVYRYFDRESGKALADEICVYDDTVTENEPHTIFDPNAVWKKKALEGFTARELLVPIFKDGRCVYESPKLDEIRSYCEHEVGKLWDEVKRFENPHEYYVDLSQRLWDIKNKLLSEKKG